MARQHPFPVSALPAPEHRIPVGISACLTGAPVRFNGSHRRSHFCTDTLSNYFAFVPLCPEVAIGLGTPREPIRLVSATTDAPLRALGTKDAQLDVTAALDAYGRSQAEEQTTLCGYIFMQKSPSCGLFSVKRYLANGYPQGTARGIYADAFCRANPLLPVEEAGRLQDAALRENFITRVFAFHDWQQFVAGGISRKGLIAFHSRYKYLVMAHSLEHYRSMGRILADLSDNNLNALTQDYVTRLMSALARPASRTMHTNTLMHLQGYLKHRLSPGDKAELTGVIHHYRQGSVPLIVPLTLLRHHLQRDEKVSAYARQQVYLNPHPYELGLHNAI